MSDPDQYIQKSVETKLAFLADGGAKLVREAADMMSEAIKNGHRIYLFGNGGSAADAQHIAGELVGRFQMERKGMPAVAFTTDTSVLTSIGNDYGFDACFTRQVEALVEKDDVVIAITTSGNSPNVVAAAELAREKGAKVIGFTGGDGGKLKDCSDLALIVPAKETCHVQEVHITIGHALCAMIEEDVFG